MDTLASVYDDMCKAHDAHQAQEDRKVRAYNSLRNALGYIDKATQNTVTIKQDEISRRWEVSCGKRKFHGETLATTLAKAADWNTIPY